METAGDKIATAKWLFMFIISRLILQAPSEDQVPEIGTGFKQLICFSSV